MDDAGAPRGNGLPALVLAHAGLDVAAYRAAPLERRVSACLRVLRAESERAARVRLEVQPELHARALDALLIGYSSFFRDRAVFDAIDRHVLPQLRMRPGPIRVWSVGCSTGAELYSMAILLAEAGLLGRTELLGTDCRPDAVAGAREGRFHEQALVEIDASIRHRYLVPTRSGWQVAAALRGAITWEVADALRHTPSGSWDVILCRNLVIYLRHAVALALLDRIAGTLRPGGHLVVGKAERPHASLGLAVVGRCLYRRHDDC